MFSTFIEYINENADYTNNLVLKFEVWRYEGTKLQIVLN